MTSGSSMTMEAQKPAGSAAPARLAEPGLFVASPVPAVATFTFPNRILFGAGSRGHLASEIARLGITRPLVVTDPGLVASGLTGSVVGPAGQAGGCLQRGQCQPGRRRRVGRSGSLSNAGVRRTDGHRRWQSDRRGQGDPAAGHASGPARRLRPDPGRSRRRSSQPCLP